MVASPKSAFTPITNQGKKWRLAYYQGGNYSDYAKSLRAIAAALVKMGWLDEFNFPEHNDPADAESVWHYLATKAKSNTMEFCMDAYWSAAWEENWRTKLRQEVIHRLAIKEDIDLVIAMGTWAGQDLVNDRHTVPTLVLTSSDPIKAGILETHTDSGHDHVLVEIDPQRYRRQLGIYYKFLGFKQLGVVFEDSEDGRIYANLADLESAAQEHDFSLLCCHAVDLATDEAISLKAVKCCYEQIASQIDALWIGFHIGEQTKFMPDSLETMFTHQIPTITSVGPAAVRRGALMSIAYTDFQAAGQWYALKIAEILHGTSPRSLDQVFEMPGQVVINLETARRIGFEIPTGLLEAANEKYPSIEGYKYGA